MALYRDKTVDVNYDASTRYYPTSVNISQYQVARSYLLKIGKSQSVANTLAIALINISKSKKISVIRLIEDFGGQIRLDDSDYFLMNLLGSSTNSINGETTISVNSDSYRARDIRI